MSGLSCHWAHSEFSFFWAVLHESCILYERESNFCHREKRNDGTITIATTTIGLHWRAFPNDSSSNQRILLFSSAKLIHWEIVMSQLRQERIVAGVWLSLVVRCFWWRFWRCWALPPRLGTQISGFGVRLVVIKDFLVPASPSFAS